MNKWLHTLIFLLLCSSLAIGQGVPELIYYRCDVATGTSTPNAANAATAVSPNGTLQGTATIGGTGQFAAALVGSGAATASNSINANWALNLSGPWTISLWLGGLTNAAPSNYLFGGSGGSTFRLFTGTGTVAPANGVVLRGTGLTDVPVPNILDAAGTPVVLHFVYDNTGTPQIRVYVNGVFHSAVNQTATVALTGTNFTVGGQGTSNGLPAGAKIDEFRMYNRALNAAEIGLTWNSTLPAIPCSGTPVAGNVTPAGPINACFGNNVTLTANGYTLAGDMYYQWELNTGAGWTPIAGATNTIYTFLPTQNAQYRFKDSCGNSNLTAVSNAVQVNVPNPTYATLPYVQGFETWVNGCGTTDVPSVNWANAPFTGNNSWRRDDQGASAAWTTPTGGAYTPASVEGSRSARFHSNTAPANSRGTLYLFLNCSNPVGNKELRFHTINTAGADSLFVLMSTNGGLNFTQIAQYGIVPAWTKMSLPLISNSATTVIAFQAKSDGSGTDIGLDSLHTLDPCNATPTAGSVAPIGLQCPNVPFSLTLTGTSQAGGLNYQWQSSTDGVTWANVPGGINSTLTTFMLANTYYRAIVTCSTNGLMDTSNTVLVSLNSFYNCYCASNATTTTGVDIGNVTIQSNLGPDVALNNGNPLPVLNNANSNKAYTDFKNLNPLPRVFRDTLYDLKVSQINSATFTTSTVAAYIDIDRDGIFAATERVLYRTTSSTSNPQGQVQDTFRLPAGMPLGVTGMRVIIVSGSAATITPCGTYANGETEDYLIKVDWPPCDGPVNAGSIISSDTSMCAGYEYTAYNTTHEQQRSNISWQWQESPDGSVWGDMPGTVDKDTITRTFIGAVYHRVRMICIGSNDTTYSPVLRINTKPPYKCYCFSQSMGGATDSSDLTTFAIAGFVLNTGGPHLLNQASVKKRTDYTDLPAIPLSRGDTTYDVQLYHTLYTANHGDAKITIFIDFNNNLQYDLPQERVLTTYTNATNWFLDTTLRIPTSVIMNVPTGMRIIVNNNVGPNVPSDEGCGAYVSGETEDYIVTFYEKGAASVGNSSKLQQLSLAPNPTTGKFRIDLKAGQTIDEVTVRVTTISGQQILRKAYSNSGNSFSQDIDLGDQASGVYFVEITAGEERIVRKIVLSK